MPDFEGREGDESSKNGVKENKQLSFREGFDLFLDFVFQCRRVIFVDVVHLIG